MQVKFYDKSDDGLLMCAVVIAKYNGRWLYCKHRDAVTFELPYGYRGEDEMIEDTARHALSRKTGAKKYTLKPVCTYSQDNGDITVFGKLYYAEIKEMDPTLQAKGERVYYLDSHPDNQSCPELHPLLVQEAIRRGFCK